MKLLSIRNRILFAVLAPATLVALLITGMLVAEQMRNAQIDQHRRLGAVARQIATAAEYYLFTGNNEALQRLLQTALREPDLVAAAFLDAREQVLVSTLPAEQLPAPAKVAEGFEPPGLGLGVEQHWHSLPVLASSLEETDLLLPNQARPERLGRLLLKMTTQTLHNEMAGYALKASVLAVSLLAFGILLAVTLSHGLIRTMTDIGQVVEGIGDGRLDLRVHDIGQDELGHLAAGINRMADAVGQTQEQLAARVTAATAALRQERDATAEAAQARSRFFAAASHDLRQPAHALGLLVARLERDAAGTALHPQLHRLGEAVASLQGLLATLLDYSRLDGQIVRVEPRPVHAGPVIGQVIDSVAEAAAAKNLALRSRIADCWLLTDPALLHRILLNLIGNAVRHTPQGGILVACRRGGREARIEVWDTGPGIAPEFKEAIFEELVQLDNPERDAEKGLGLGLAIVRRSAALLGHPVSLCSRVGQGSRFALRVPLAAPPPPEEADAAEPAAGHPRLLQVGAPTAEHAALAAQLDTWHFAVARAADLEAASDWIAAHGAPRLLILELPEGAAGVAAGQAWLDRMAKTAPVPPALFIAGGPMPPLEPPAGSTRLLLTRPFRPARLRALLTGLLAAADEETA